MGNNHESISYKFKPHVLNALREHDIAISENQRPDGQTIVCFTSKRSWMKSEDDFGPYRELQDGERAVVPGTIIIGEKIFMHAKTPRVPQRSVSFDIDDLKPLEDLSKTAA